MTLRKNLKDVNYECTATNSLRNLRSNVELDKINALSNNSMPQVKL